MSDHVKPTKEELEAQIKQSQEAIDKIEQDNTPTEEAPEPEVDQTPEEQPAEADDTEETVVPDDSDDEGEEESQEEEKTPQPSDDIDYKKKWSESTREAMVQAAKNKKFNEAVQAADELPDPTEQELTQEAALKGFNFDELDSIQKALFKDSVVSQRKLNLISSVAKEGKDIEAWNGKVDEFLDNPENLNKYPELEGKQDQFKVFSTKPTRRGLDFEDLVLAFNGDLAKAKVKHKGQMFETGKSGPKDVKPKTDILTADQGRQLMKTNYKEFIRKLKAGKIANS